MKLGLALAVISLIGFGCSDRTLPVPGHQVVTIDTDAWLPLPLEAPVDPARPPALFDRLSISVTRADQADCPACTRDFAVDTATFGTKGATFSIEAAPGEQPIVRAVLYRSDSVIDGQIHVETTISLGARLPPTPNEGGVETTLELLTEDVGSPASRAVVVDPSDAPDARVRLGHVDHSRVGTWPGVLRRPCDGTPMPGEVCVPGGAYWMGNPLAKGDGFSDSDQQRLVVVSPFYLDDREVTVGQLRAWAAAQPIPVDVTPEGVTSEDGFCTFSDTDTSNDDKPVNCIGWETARRYCEDRGAELPSEAQFEYASSALRSALYIWGQDEAAICGAAVWGRAGASLAPTSGLESKCANLGEGPQALVGDPSQTRATDKIGLDAGTIYDLAGNLQEWSLDRYNKQNESCWQITTSNVFSDPICDIPGEAADARSVRGGSWVQDRAFLRAAYRAARAPNQQQRYLVGFRCARQTKTH